MKPVEKLAFMLNNREYRFEYEKEHIWFARENNLLIVHGCSDDIVMINGIIHEEYYSEKLWFLKNKIICTEDDFEDIKKAKKELERYGIKVSNLGILFTINVKFPNEEGFKFELINESDQKIEYDRFTVLEDGKEYGQGLVIQL